MIWVINGLLTKFRQVLFCPIINIMLTNINLD